MTEAVMEGRVLAEKYEITRLLGQGGMGAVYEARNHLGKRFAVKLLLKPELIHDPQLIQRFFREAKASASIESEHIVEVYDTGVDPSTNFPFIIMEMLKGEDLEHTINRVGALNPIASARVISQAANGLGAAHAAGIVHRDIKPANIFMTMRGPGDLVVKILDFGIAKQAVEQLSSQDAGLTKTGSMLGTPLYMSPEQARGLRNIDLRTDIWSLGMCLYESLSGRTPWGSVDTLGDLILSICARDVMPLQEVAPWVPNELAAVVHRALTRDPLQRTGNCQQLIEQLVPFTGNAMTITPDILTGVADGQRNAGQGPRIDLAAISSVSAVTSSQPGNQPARMTTSPGHHLTGGATTGQIERKSSTGMYIGIGIAAVVLLGAGGFAVVKMTSKPPPDMSDTPASGGGGDEGDHDKGKGDGKGKGDDKGKDDDKKTVDKPQPTATAPTATATATTTATATATATEQPTATGKPTGKPNSTTVPVKPTATATVTATATATAAPKKKNNGETCSGDGECVSGTCTNGLCSRKITGGLD